MKCRSVVVAVHNIVLIVIITTMSNSSNADSTKAYIECICDTTPNLIDPKGCVNMLGPYSESLNHDLCHTTLTAVNISLIRANRLVKKVKQLLKKNKIVTECVDYIEAAKSEIQDSLDQMSNLGVGGDLDFAMSNVQTWMSSAMTSLDDCQEEAGAYVKDATTNEIEDRRKVNTVLLKGTSRLLKVLSSTLALANALADPHLHQNECGGT